MDAWVGKEYMDCKSFERLIPDFIAQKMDYPTLKSFLGHMGQCADCREELEIQFLVSEGIRPADRAGTASGSGRAEDQIP